LSKRSPNFLATVYLLDVVSLSRRANLESASDPLQTGFRFFQHPVLHLDGLSLRLACLSPATHVDRNDPGRMASCHYLGEKIGSSRFQAEIQGFHVPHQKFM